MGRLPICSGLLYNSAMPKLSIDFPAQLSLQVTREMRIHLLAIGYYTGNGGEYATPARNLLHKAIQEYQEKLAPKERKEYEEILANVRAAEEAREAMKENQKSPVV